MREIIINYRSALLSGLLTTLEISVISWICGIVFGVLLGAVAGRFKHTIGIFAKGFAFFLSSIPVLVLLFWLHYPLQTLLGVTINPLYTAIATLSLLNIFAVADLVRSAVADFPEQYVIAGKVCGLRASDIFRDIKLPILTRQLVPGILTIQVVVLQGTLFASLISVDELFRTAQRINALEYRPVEIYTGLALFFLLICLPLNLLSAGLRRRFGRHLEQAPA